MIISTKCKWRDFGVLRSGVDSLIQVDEICFICSEELVNWRRTNGLMTECNIPDNWLYTYVPYGT